MSLHVREDDAASGLVNGTDDHVDNIPIGIERAVGKARFEWSCGVDSFEERVVVTAKLKFPEVGLLHWQNWNRWWRK